MEISEENIEQDINLSSSPILQPQSEMDIYFQSKITQKELKQEKINKIEQAKSYLSDIIEIEYNQQIQTDLIEGLNYLDFLIQKIKNPIIQSPKQTALNEISLKILDLDKKIDLIQKKNTAVYNNHTEPIQKENTMLPPSPRVVIPVLKKKAKTLEDSIHNDNNDGFQIVKSKKKTQKENKIIKNNNNINNKGLSQENNNNTLKNQVSKEERNRFKEKQKEKRLILQVPTEFIDNLAPFALRNEINRAFETNNLDKVVIASITKSQSNLSIILTTIEDFSAKFLIEHQEIWKSLVPFTKYQLDKEWTKLIVHNVLIKPFECEEGLNILKEEIENYNTNIQLTRVPNWLVHEEIRLQKHHSSIVIYLSDQLIANSLINKKIFIAGELCKVEKYIPRSTQCEKCQQYGHTKFRCKNEFKCVICAEKHDSIAHFCAICHSKEYCIHLPIKCANCGENHKSNNKICKEWQRVNSKINNEPLIDLMEIN